MSTPFFYSSSVAPHPRPHANPNGGCCFYELVYKLACCLISQRINSCIPPQIRCACYACRAYYNYEKRRQAQAPIKDKIVYPGDIFKVSVPGSCCAVDAIFGMSNQQVFQLVPDPVDPEKARFCVKDKSCSPVGESQTVKPERGATLIPAEKALTLATRMAASGLSFPFKSVRCNSHHYMDYLRYGKRKFNFFLVSRECPVNGEIDDPNARNFKLEDYRGNSYDVGPPIQPPSVTTGLRGDSIRKVGAKIIKQGQECLPCFGGNGFPPPSP